MNNTYKIIGPIHQLVTMADLPIKGALSHEQMPVIENAAMILKGETIHAVGTVEDIQAEAKNLDIDWTPNPEEALPVVIPGFVDSHTHICFAGSRARDYAMRNAGKSYLEIAKAGGGIWDTVTQTRKASEKDLTANTIMRVLRHQEEGVTTIEVKSGYGLSVEEELKMLRAIKEANQAVAADLIPTCLAAHIKPKDFEGDFDAYLQEISEKLFPVLKAENLANRIDAFIEEEAFSAKVVKPYFEKAKEMGFDITVHADQFSASGSAVAVDFDALSADHLEASGEKEVALLANSNVVATALPGASMGLGCDFTPARKILDAGGALNIASDWNPGSAPMGDLMMQACVLGTFEKLSNTELLAALTFRAAAALNLNDRGRLTKDMKADFLVYDVDSVHEIFYHQGKIKPDVVYISGEKI